MSTEDLAQPIWSPCNTPPITKVLAHPLDEMCIGQPGNDGSGWVFLPVEPRHLLGERGLEGHQPYPHRQPFADEGKHADLKGIVRKLLSRVKKLIYLGWLCRILQGNLDLSESKKWNNNEYWDNCLQKHSNPHSDSKADVRQGEHNRLAASLLHTCGQNAQNLKFRSN